MHYDDLSADLDREMRHVADRLGIAIPDDIWPDLVHAATFATMRSRAGYLAQGPPGVLKDSAAFFRPGQSGSARAVLTAEETARYQSRMAELASPDLMAWLHRE